MFAHNKPNYVMCHDNNVTWSDWKYLLLDAANVLSRTKETIDRNGLVWLADQSFPAFMYGLNKSTSKWELLIFDMNTFLWHCNINAAYVKPVRESFLRTDDALLSDYKKFQCWKDE
jgi:hypothetical protein